MFLLLLEEKVVIAPPTKSSLTALSFPIIVAKKDDGIYPSLGAPLEKRNQYKVGIASVYQSAFRFIAIVIESEWSAPPLE